MEQIKSRRTLSLLLAMALIVSLFSGLTITASAENLTGTPTGYTKASDVNYDTSGTYLKNWGARGEDCVFLTSYAQSYYTGSYSYETLAANAGGTSESDATGSALYAALQNMLQAKHTTHTSYSATRSMYCYTDCVNNNSDYISSFYSSTQVTGTWDSGATWNREHTWPHSKDADTNTNTDSNDSTDIMMLRPTAVNENSSRSNKAYGESSGYFDPNTVSTAVNVHGDCARIVLFTYTEYGASGNDIWSNMWGTSGVIESKEILLQWMQEDPVDTWEMARNDVTENITGVRNVFVDYPELAFQLFGAPVPAGYTTPSGGSAASSYTVTATSNNTSWGTVSVSGNVITASPATGYYAAGYTVTSGTAVVTQVGNTFTVNPTSDCTVQINFAAKTQVTITYMANGAQYNTVACYAGDSVTLPSTATAVDGWTVSGWSASTVSDTTEKPEYYELGASFTPTANTTLYAVYTKTEAGSGTGDYVQVETSEDLDPGTYLIVYTNGGVALDGSLEELDSSAGNKISVNISNKTIASTATIDASSFTIDPVAGTILSASGYYIGSNTDNSNTLRFSKTEVYTNEIAIETNGDADIVASAGSHLRYNTGGRFRYYKSATYTGQQAIQLYKKDGAGGVTTYTTSPTETEHTHSLTHFDAVSPTCGADGNIEYWFCAGCGKYFSDANAVDEISQTDIVIPATDNHTFGDWASNSNGTHSRTCSVCGTVETENCVYTNVVTPPTPTEQGYTTHTCAVCAYSYVDNYTDPIGANYTVTFTVPAGITAPAAMTINSVTGAELPTADAPEGYAFLGWVVEDYDNVTTRPTTILTGNYKPTADITLKALYTYSEAGGSTAPTLTQMTTSDTLAEGDKIVITESNGVYGLYQQTTNTSYVKNFAFTNNAETIQADALNYLDVTAAENGWYLGDEANGYLYTSGSNNLAVNTSGSKTVWTLTTKGDYLALTGNGHYLSCRTDLTTSNANLWRMGGTAGTSGTCTLVIYKLTEGEASTAYYTTIISGAAHTPVFHEAVPATCTEAGNIAYYTCQECDKSSSGEHFGKFYSDSGLTVELETIAVPATGHTPGAVEHEKEFAPTCTAPGSYDAVVYCTVCDAELSRETVTVPATGHTAGEAVRENEVAATCTEAGGYDLVTYCTVCGAEISRVHNEVPATGHTPGEVEREKETAPTCTEDGSYDAVICCTVCGEELSHETVTVPALGHTWGNWISNNDGTHTRTCSVCNETETHDCNYGDDNICDDCGYEQSTEMTDIEISTTLALEAATTFNLYVNKAALDAYALDSFKIVFVHTKYDTNSGTYTDYTYDLTAREELHGSDYWFEYADIPAMMLNDHMTMKVVGEKNGETWEGGYREFNPIGYCYLASEKSSNMKLRKTSADLIRFCAAAQTYFNYNTANLATNEWTNTQEAVATNGDPTLADYRASTPLEGAVVSINSNTLDVSGRVKLNYYMTVPTDMDYSALTLELSYVDFLGQPQTVTVSGETWTKSGNEVYATLSTLNAAEMRKVVTAVVKDANGNAISNTRMMSIESYAWAANNANSTSLLSNMCRAMLNYGTSANAYLTNS